MQRTSVFFWYKNGKIRPEKERKRDYPHESIMSKAAIIFIIILFHDSGYRRIKQFLIKFRSTLKMYVMKVCPYCEYSEQNLYKYVIRARYVFRLSFFYLLHCPFWHLPQSIYSAMRSENISGRYQRQKMCIRQNIMNWLGIECSGFNKRSDRFST